MDPVHSNLVVFLLENTLGLSSPPCFVRALATSSSAFNAVSFDRALDNFEIIEECRLFGEPVIKAASPCTTRNPKQPCPIWDRIAWEPPMLAVVF
eukprot:10577016-Karenia_brevis.AAC.1